MANKKSKKQTSKQTEEKKLPLDEIALGLTKAPDGIYYIVKVKYNFDTKEAKLVELKPISDDMGVAEESFKMAVVDDVFA